jgi:hypothetical protein
MYGTKRLGDTNALQGPGIPTLEVRAPCHSSVTVAQSVRLRYVSAGRLLTACSHTPRQG